MKQEIFIIEEHCGDLVTVMDVCYWYYEMAVDKANFLQEQSNSKGYTDFKYKVKSLEIIGLS